MGDCGRRIDPLETLKLDLEDGFMGIAAPLLRT
jgi:hypothetical protein